MGSPCRCVSPSASMPRARCGTPTPNGVLPMADWPCWRSTAASTWRSDTGRTTSSASATWWPPEPSYCDAPIESSPTNPHASPPRSAPSALAGRPPEDGQEPVKERTTQTSHPVVRLRTGKSPSWVGRPGNRRSGVEAVDGVGVVVLDDVALDLHRGGELTGLDGEVVVEELPLLDRPPPVGAGVGPPGGFLAQPSARRGGD